MKPIKQNLIHIAISLPIIMGGIGLWMAWSASFTDLVPKPSESVLANENIETPIDNTKIAVEDNTDSKDTNLIDTISSLEYRLDTIDSRLGLIESNITTLQNDTENLKNTGESTNTQIQSPALTINDGDLSYLTELGYVEIPLKRKTQYFEVQVEINGQNAYLLIDTGANSTSLDRTRSERFEIDKDSEIPVGSVIGLGGEQTTASRVYVSSLKVGNHLSTDIGVILVDLSPINESLESNGFYPIDGILGDDFFSKNNVILDYDAEKMYIKNN